MNLKKSYFSPVIARRIFGLPAFVSTLFILNLLFFAAAVFLEWHGSSIPVWNSTFKVPSNYQNGLVFRKPLTIRTDEYLVSVPWKISQAQLGFPTQNANLGGGDTALMISCTYSWIAVFKPNCWGYFLWGASKGFSFEWNVFGLMTFWSFFALLWLLTQNGTISLVASLWMYCSAYFIWWSGLPQVFGFSLSLVGFYTILKGRGWWQYLCGAVAIIFGAVHIALTLYVPWILSLLYVAIFIFVGWMLQNVRSPSKEKIFSRDRYLLYSVIIASLSLTIVGIVLWQYKMAVQSTVEMLLNTEYPGKRISTSGQFPLMRVFSGIFDVWFSESRQPTSFANVCEASSFIMLFPFVVLAWLKDQYYERKWIKEDALIVSLSLFCVLAFVFIWHGFGVQIESYLFLDRIPSSRAIIGLGIGNILLTAVYWKRTLSSSALELSTTVSKKKSVTTSVAFGLISLTLVTYVAFRLYQEDSFYRDGKIVFGTLFWLAIAFAIFKQKWKVFAFFILALTLPNWRMHPVSVGLRPFTEREVYKKVISLQQQDRKAKWVVFGNMRYANFLKTTGVVLLNGTHFTPDFKVMSVLDPAGKNKHVYNRYAHITMAARPVSEPQFVLNFLDDFSILVDPCASYMTQLGVRYFVFEELGQQWACLQPLGVFDNLHLFKRQ